MAIADVRRFPRSRRHPQFNTEALAEQLPRYEHIAELGGRRGVVAGSPNAGWEVAAFQGYADHLASDEFARGMTRLVALAREVPTAVMCAEGPWWRCHRRLVCDALLVRGWDVRHILPDGGLVAHELTDFAVADGERLTYPAPQLRL